MRATLVFALLCGVLAAQKPPASGAPGAPLWRQTFGGILNRLPGSLNVRDLQLLESQMAMSGAYCTGLTPGDYEANRQLVRQMVTYLATVQVATQDREMNASLGRLTRSLGAFPCAYALPPQQQAQPGAPPPPPAPGEPPFSKQAPALKNIAKADQEAANDLKERYESVASRAAVAWQNAEVVRRGLIAKGMNLNAQTAASVDHLKLFLDQATTALNAHDWKEAGEALDRTEYETQKVGKAVGN
jgi:hypothetical protein